MDSQPYVYVPVSHLAWLYWRVFVGGLDETVLFVCRRGSLVKMLKHCWVVGAHRY